MFMIPCVLLLGLLIVGCVLQSTEPDKNCPLFLALATVLLFCQLFYDVVLLTGSGPAEGKGVVAHKKAMLSVAETVVFAGSAVSLLLVLFMHRSCRESLKGALRQLRDCCRGLGGAQTHITTPDVEITDTLQDNSEPARN